MAPKTVPVQVFLENLNQGYSQGDLSVSSTARLAGVPRSVLQRMVSPKGRTDQSMQVATLQRVASLYGAELCVRFSRAPGRRGPMPPTQ